MGLHSENIRPGRVPDFTVGHDLIQSPQSSSTKKELGNPIAGFTRRLGEAMFMGGHRPSRGEPCADDACARCR
jgi:hypothetical protein